MDLSQIEASTTRPKHLAGRSFWWAVIAVALGTFTVVTSEMLAVGLLRPIGTALDVSDGTAGLMMTVPGGVAAISAPLLVVAGGRLDRRTALVGMMALLIAANLLQAAAPNFTVMLVARLLVGLAIGGFWAVGASIAPRLAPPESVGRAMAVIFSGVAAASVIGVPAGTYLSELLDWRTAFLVFAGFSGAVLAAIAVLVPAMPQRSAVRFAEFGAVLRRPAFRVVLAALGLTVLGHFAAYTFVTPALRDLADAGPALIGGLLLVYGAAGLVGNFAAPSFAARSLPGTVLGTTVLLAAAMAVFPSAVGAAGLPAAVLLLVLWGVGYGAVPATLQLWNLQVVKDEPEAGSALFVTVFQGSIAVGAALGGAVVDGSSPSAALWFGAALAGAAVLVVGLAGRRQR